MELPERLLEIHARLTRSLDSRDLRIHSTDNGDACCDEHCQRGESADPATRDDAADLAASAWLGVAGDVELQTNLAASELLTGLLQGHSYNHPYSQDLLQVAETLTSWLAENAQAVAEDEVGLRVALEAALKALVDADDDHLVKSAAFGERATWEISDEGDEELGYEPLRLVALTEDDIKAIAQEALVAP